MSAAVRVEPERPSRRVLLVDDDASVRLGLGPILEGEGMEVTTASSPAEASEWLRRRRFDLVITDLRLEGAGGRQGLDVISRARQACPAATIVLFTAFGGKDVREEAVRRGAFDLWEKSTSIPDLVRRVRDLDGGRSPSGAGASPRRDGTSAPISPGGGPRGSR